MSSTSHHKKKKKLPASGTPDLFWTILRLGDNDSISFFYNISSQLYRGKEKELIEEFKKSVSRSNITFGMGGILPDWNARSTEDIQKLKYIYPESKSEPTESGDKGIDLLDREEAQIPAAACFFLKRTIVRSSWKESTPWTI